jgi:hypothetical protein
MARASVLALVMASSLSVATATATGADTTVPPTAAEATATGTVRALTARGPYRDELLSNERTLSRWANSISRARIRTEPRVAARTLGHLRLLTEDGRPEIYLVLESRVDSRGRTWMRIRVPGRPNGRTGWVLEPALGQLHAVRTKLRVNRSTLRATLFRDGRMIFQTRIGVGKASTPTPAGHFWIRERLRNLNGGRLYGPWAFGTSNYSVLSDWPGGGVVGIHGTDQPQLIPGRPSHGCIRMRNASITRLVKLMPLGTPVEIL